MAKYAYIAVAGLFIALCVCGWLLKNSWQENAKLETAIYQQQEIIETERKRAAEYENILVQRESEIRDLENKTKAALDEVEKARQENKVFRDWGDELLPADVHGLL